jgi:hypothetical protein
MATGRKQYTLYLDESETHKYNKVTNKNEECHFCMAGIIVAIDDYDDLETSVNALKRRVWSEFPNPEEIILHQMLVNDAESSCCWKIIATFYVPIMLLEISYMSFVNR